MPRQISRALRHVAKGSANTASCSGLPSHDRLLLIRAAEALADGVEVSGAGHEKPVLGTLAQVPDASGTAQSNLEHVVIVLGLLGDVLIAEPGEQRARDDAFAGLEEVDLVVVMPAELAKEGRQARYGRYVLQRRSQRLRERWQRHCTGVAET
eukprot:scaffold368_cov258-Pinguiococcus_pyrenoidosus.AAC.15